MKKESAVWLACARQNERFLARRRARARSSLTHAPASPAETDCPTVSEILPRVELVEQLAKEKGLVVFYPRPWELFLDLDNHSPDHAPWVLPIHAVSLRKEYDVRVRTTRSAGGHMHAYVALLDLDFLVTGTASLVLTARERVGIQAALGSDPKRELLAIQGLMSGVFEGRCHSVLFETPDQATTVLLWRDADYPYLGPEQS